jgi:hypothetical protein
MLLTKQKKDAEKLKEKFDMEQKKISLVQQNEITSKKYKFDYQCSQEAIKLKGSVKMYNSFINTIKKGKPRSQSSVKKIE